jgi:hypothetical protein
MMGIRLKETTLREARERLMNERDKGTTCPCCGQYAKVYRRSITSGTAWLLVQMFDKAMFDWYYVPSLGAQGGDLLKTRFWGLIEESEDVRDDGSGRAGWWRITDLGGQFVRGLTTVPKYALIYNNHCLGLEGPNVSIEDIRPFNYDDLMRGA